MGSSCNSSSPETRKYLMRLSKSSRKRVSLRCESRNCLADSGALRLLDLGLMHYCAEDVEWEFVWHGYVCAHRPEIG